jgi:hypothetical protein
MIEKTVAFLSKTKRLDQILFLITLFVLCNIYEYPESLNFLPQSLHNWRQADCAAFARMYYEHGMHFFEPKVYNLLMGEGNAAGECPIFYYFIACLYKLFGPHDSIFRLVNLLIFSIGLFSLFSIIKQILHDRFFSFIIPLLLFSSPLIMLFADGFLCDTTSLSMTFIAWNFILRYRDNKNQKYFWLSMLFFALAGLLKLNSAISFVALGALFFIELNGWQKTQENIIFVHKRNNIIGFILVSLVVLCWYGWAIQYNAKYSVSFLGTKIWPGWSIWETTDQNFVRTINGFFGDSVYIFFQPTYALIIFLLFFIHANRTKLEPLFYSIFLLILIGVSLFVFTFFLGIRDNIYYCINLFVLPVFIFIFSCRIMQKYYPKTFSSIVFRMIILLFLIGNINYAKGTLKDFYHEGKLHFKVNDNFSKPTFQKFIDSIGIKKDDKVISFPDITPDATLYAIGRQGWSEYNISRADTGSINYCIGQGAKYLIISGAYVLSEPAMECYCGNFVGCFDNIYVYKLGERQRNHSNKNIKIKTKSHQFFSIGDPSSGRRIISKDSADAATFYLFYLGNGSVGLKSASGEFVSCDMNNDKKLFINSAWFGTWEAFHLVKKTDETFALKALNGKYVSLKEKEGGVLRADADVIGSNEIFTISK